MLVRHWVGDEANRLFKICLVLHSSFTQCADSSVFYWMYDIAVAFYIDILWFLCSYCSYCYTVGLLFI